MLNHLHFLHYLKIYLDFSAPTLAGGFTRRLRAPCCCGLQHAQQVRFAAGGKRRYAAFGG